MVIDDGFDITAQKLDEYYLANKNDILRLYNGESGSATECGYPEYKYNYKIGKEKEFYLFDRMSTQFDGIEICDLFDPAEKSLIHVKMGDTAKFDECLRQSHRGASYYHRNKSNVESISNIEDRNIEDVHFIKVLFLRKNQNSNAEWKPSKIKSIKCKLTIIDWFNAVKTMNYIPQIIVAKYS